MNLTEGDHKLFHLTARLAAGVALLALILLIFWMLARVLAHFYSLLLPLAIAGVLALVLDPLVRSICRTFKVGRSAAVSLLGGVMLISLVPLSFFVLPAAIDQVRELVESLPDLLSHAIESMEQRFPGLTGGIVDYLEDFEFTELATHSDAVLKHASNMAGVVVGLLFVPLFLFFMLLSGGRINHGGKELLSIFRNDKQEEIHYLVTLFIGYVTAFFQGQLVIALIMGILLATGFSIIGLQAAIVLGLILGLLNIVPFLGVIVGLLVVLPIAWLQPDGGLQLVGLVMVVFASVQLIESWVLTPRIMSQKSGLHPALVVISLFFWGLVFNGIIGMLLAVPLSAFLLALWKHAKERYLSSIVTNESLILEDSSSTDPSVDLSNDK